LRVLYLDDDPKRRQYRARRLRSAYDEWREAVDAVDPALDALHDDWQVRGWLGTARFPKDLDSDEAGNLNGIVIFARGRLIHTVNPDGGRKMYDFLVNAGVEVQFLPFRWREDLERANYILRYAWPDGEHPPLPGSTR